PSGRRVGTRLGLAFDGGNAAVAPGFEDRVQQRPAIPEAAVEPALGDTQPFGQHLDPNAVDAGACKFRKARRHPVPGCLLVHGAFRYRVSTHGPAANPSEATRRAMVRLATLSEPAA